MGKYNIPKIKPSEWAFYLANLTPKDTPIFGHGQPGIGKTEIVYQVAKEMGDCYVIVFLAQLKAPEDIKGILAIIDGEAKWLDAPDLPKILKHGKRGIFFCDDLLFAVPATTNCLMELTTKRKFGDYELPPDWVIVAASNREEDRAQIFELSGPLANRFDHYEVAPDYEDWESWAIQNDISPEIISFLKLKPQLLASMPDGLLAYPTPRSWGSVDSKMKKQNWTEDQLRKSIGAAVGIGAATEFWAHRKIGTRALQIINEILNGKYPNKRLEAAMQWTINIHFVQKYIKDPKKFAKPIAKYCLHMATHKASADSQPPKEFGHHLLKKSVKSAEKVKDGLAIVHLPEFQKLAKTLDFIYEG